MKHTYSSTVGLQFSVTVGLSLETSDLTVTENVGNVEVCLTANTTAAVDIVVHASTKQETASGQFLYIHMCSICVFVCAVCLCSCVFIIMYNV